MKVTSYANDDQSPSFLMILLLPSVFPLFSRLWRSSLASLFRKTGNFRHEVTDEELQFFGEPAQTLEELQEIQLIRRMFVVAPENPEEVVEIKKGRKVAQRALIDLTEKSDDSRYPFNQKYFMSAGRYDEFKGKKEMIMYMEMINDGKQDDCIDGRDSSTVTPETKEVVVEDSKPFSRILHPFNRSYLYKVLEKTTPQTYIKFILLNKQMFSDFANSDKFKIKCHLHELRAEDVYEEEDYDIDEDSIPNLEVTLRTDEKNQLSQEEVDALRQLPFILFIDLFCYCNLEHSTWNTDVIYDFVESLPIHTIRRVELFGPSTDWRRFLAVIGKYNVKELEIYEGTDVPDQVLADLYSSKTLDLVCHYVHNVRQELYIHSTIPEIGLFESCMNVDGVAVMIDRFLEGFCNVEWMMCSSNMDLRPLFHQFLVLPHDFHYGLPSIRPLVFALYGPRKNSFWIVREDNAVLMISWKDHHWFTIRKFEKNEGEEFPPSPAVLYDL